MPAIVCAHRSQSVEFEFDSDDDVEVLRFQVLSLFEDLSEDFVLVDFAGRELVTLQDLEELQMSTTAMLTNSDSNGVKKCAKEAPLYVWVVDLPFPAMPHGLECSSLVFATDKEDAEGVIQPRYKIIDTPFDICLGCKKHVSPGLLQSPNVPMTSLQPFQCKAKQAFEFGLTLDSYNQQSILAEGTGVNNIILESPVGKYFRWHFLQAAVESQSMYAQGGSTGAHTHTDRDTDRDRDTAAGRVNVTLSEGERQVEGRLRSGVQTVRAYEDPEQQRKARECVDFDKVVLETISGTITYKFRSKVLR
jgi:hypothetical protein